MEGGETAKKRGEKVIPCMGIYESWEKQGKSSNVLHTKKTDKGKRGKVRKGRNQT